MLTYVFRFEIEPKSEVKKALCGIDLLVSDEKVVNICFLDLSQF
jgi:hypothetical protein